MTTAKNFNLKILFYRGELLRGRMTKGENDKGENDKGGE